MRKRLKRTTSSGMKAWPRASTITTTRENPFKDWHHVYIPYCTADIHWGDAERTYENEGQAFTIRHKGGVNTRAVLSWVYENVPSPEKVFVTGSAPVRTARSCGRPTCETTTAPRRSISSPIAEPA